jgi:hypothetical protein
MIAETFINIPPELTNTGRKPRHPNVVTIEKPPRGRLSGSCSFRHAPFSMARAEQGRQRNLLSISHF